MKTRNFLAMLLIALSGGLSLQSYAQADAPEPILGMWALSLDYENNNSLESWMNNALFICEDIPPFDFLGAAMGIAENFPPYIREYFIFETDTSVYYGNKDSIYNAINNRGVKIKAKSHKIGFT